VYLMHVGGNNVEIKTEADGNDITGCIHDDMLTPDMFAIYLLHYPHLSTLISLFMARLMILMFYY